MADARKRHAEAIELTDNLLWLLKQAFRFSLSTVNEAVSSYGVTTAQIGLMRQLANEPGLSGAELARRPVDQPAGSAASADLPGATRTRRAQARPATWAHPSSLSLRARSGGYLGCRGRSHRSAREGFRGAHRWRAPAAERPSGSGRGTRHRPSRFRRPHGSATRRIKYLMLSQVLDNIVAMTRVDVTEQVMVELDRRTTVARYQPGNTLLQTARLAGLSPPYSCETGSCATCMARIVEGSARMLNNEALTDDEVAEGWVLTCQSLPTSPSVRVVYE